MKRIAICGAKKGYGYPGFGNWKKKLVKLGIPERKIVGVQISSDFPPSTHAEAWGIVRYAKKSKWRTLYIVAPPLHQLRAFVTTVTALIREKARVLAYNFVGMSQRWEEHIIHSQGIQKGTRSELLTEEFEKMERYYKKGDLISGEEVLKYLDKRDARRK